ncbi:PQQ-dependent sugar dehydrogenase [Actinokineospora guangxiensis]|uniref:PQQ-dependent sugar dehydrogenase n=1 Tax=Actinokineospora guangxiensis TaxID=1490288 RepID=A0ABW0EPK0_9PSEU
MKPGRIRAGAFAAALAAGLVAGLVAILPAGAAQAPALPAGFLLKDTPTGLAEQGDALTDFAYLPDSSVVAVGKFGRVMWVPKTGAPRRIATLPVRTEQDLGLIGVGVAADYANSRHLYTARTAPSTAPGSGAYGVLRLSRWTVQLDANGEPSGLTGEQTLVETSADSDIHGMTGVAVAPDGTIWLSIGDSRDNFVSTVTLRAGLIDDLHGKILHLRPDGSGVPNNPYYDAAKPRAARSLVYASGFRSPFRISLDPVTETPIVGDVGWNAFEEVNHITPGGDYGWPCWEGTVRTPGFRDLPGCATRSTLPPQHAYAHGASTGSSITGGVVYTGSNYPLEYAGSYFFGDYTSGRLWTMRFDAAGRVVTPSGTRGTNVGGPVALRTMPVSGDVVYADIFTGSLRRIVYQAGNRPPVPDLASTADPATGRVSFDATGSSDPDGDALTYAWDFGDGATATGPTAERAYAGAGGYTATLTVTDQFGATATKTASVHPRNHAPSLVLTPPSASSRYAVGDVISASAQASDAEDGAVDIEWSSNLIHCRGQDCHTHPGTRQTGNSFSLAYAGHPGDTRLEITATATDSLGARTTSTFTAQPRQRRLTVQSATAADFTIGDQQTTTDLFTVGQQLSVIAPQASRDGVATFERWSDGSGRVRELTMPDADVTLTATYLTPIDRRYASDAALRAVVGAPKAVEQGDATARWREYATGRVYWGPNTGGAFEIHGSILVKYLASGGHVANGLPTSDELVIGTGRQSLLAGGRSVVYSGQTGARLLGGPIRQRWLAMGATSSVLRFPTGDDKPTPDGIGRYSHFQGGSIYHTAATGAHEVYGAILAKWRALGWEKSVLGYPTSGELAGTGGGRYNLFQRGSIHYIAGTGAFEVRGSIYLKYKAMGSEKSVLRYPTTDEKPTPDGIGRYNHFQGGSIYYTGRTGAHEVYGRIRAKWQSMGWERSYLGYPVSGEYAVAGGRRNNFQGGYIIYTFADQTARAYRR